MIPNTAIALLCSATLGVALASTHRFLAPAQSHPEAEAGQGASGSALAPDALGALDALTRDMTALQQRLATLERRPSSGEAARTDLGALERLVREAVAEALAEGGAAAAPAAHEDVADRTVDDLVEEVLTASELARAELWSQLASEGRADEVLEALRQRADAAPDDPEKQLELGQAYIARIADVGNSPLAGAYALQADAAFDRALAADPEHHSARFHKAVALSFWPPVFGKQSAAIAQFEQLVAQQQRLAPQPSFAETHLLLGNLYQQTGQRDKAVAAWRDGLALFPGHGGLTQQLELLQQGH